mgnify:CR=1 FL=1
MHNRFMERRTGHEEKTCSHQCMPFILDIESTNHSPFDTMGACGDVWDVLKIYWSLLLGNILEWYEFAIFAFLEPYLQSNFFHGSAITTWLGFASTFLARPFGGLVLGILGDLFGRKVSTFLSILGMLIGTVGQGMVPTYQSGQICGTIGVVLLVVFRILQGICTGGEIAAVSTYITEVGAKRSLARCMVLIGITCNIGFLLAQFASYLVLKILGEPAMTSWGWRIPFIIALLPGTLAVCGRRCIPETSSFVHAQAEAAQAVEARATSAFQNAQSKMKTLFKSHRPAMWVSIMSVAAAAVIYYAALSWCYVLLQKGGASSSSLIMAGVMARSIAIGLAPFVGWLADIKGVAWIQFLGGAMLAITGIPNFVAMESNAQSDTAVVVFYGLGYGILLAFAGLLHFLYVVELFPVEIRNMGVGMSFNIGFCIFGGFAPMISEALHDLAFWAPGVFQSLAGIVTATTVVLSFRFQSRGVLCLAHVRDEPYFDSKAPCWATVKARDTKEEELPAKEVSLEKFQVML